MLLVFDDPIHINADTVDTYAILYGLTNKVPLETLVRGG
jgi:hypothetical protein